MSRAGMIPVLMGSLVPLLAVGDAGTARAATFAVSVTSDGNDASPGDGTCEVTAGKGDCSLRAALAEAGFDGAPATIRLPPGLYAVNAAATSAVPPGLGPLRLRDAVAAAGVDITIEGTAAPTTLIDAQALGTLFVVNAGATVALTNLTLLRAGTSTAPVVLGAALDNSAGGTVTLTGCIVTASYNRPSGVIVNSGALRLDNSQVIDNFSSGISTTGGTLDLVNGTLIGTNSGAQAGGGLMVSGAGTVVHLDHARVVANRVSASGGTGAGGGILMNGGTVTIDASSITDNAITTNAGGGAGIAVLGGTLTVRESTLARNGAGKELSGASAIPRVDGGALLVGPVLTGEATAPASGATGGTVTLRNVTVSTNRSVSAGGAIALIAGSLSIQSSTIIENGADADNKGKDFAGGGIFAADAVSGVTRTVSLLNTILARNALGNGDPDDCSGTIDSLTFSILGRSSGCSVSNQVNSRMGNVPPIDPLTRRLGLYGGGVETHDLLPGSPAIDTGGSCSGADTRGVSRPQDGNLDGPPVCDIGAIEYAPVTITSFTVSPTIINVGATASLSWSTIFGEACAIDHGVGTVGLNVTGLSVSPTSTTVYRLTCTSHAGSATSSAVLVVRPALVDTFEATPPTIPLGGQAVLSWSTTDATACSIDQGIGSVSTAGVHTVDPARTTTYSLTCTGAGVPVGRVVTVEVRPVSITSFTASPAAVNAGSAATLAWQATETSGCTIDPGGIAVAGAGSLEVTPSTRTTYALSCQGQDGPAAAALVVRVDPVTINSFTTDPDDALVRGDTGLLVWDTANAAGCTIDNDIGAVEPTGKLAVSPGITTTYTLTCDGADGESSFESVTMSVVAPQHRSEDAGCGATGAPPPAMILGLLLLTLVRRGRQAAR